MQLKTKELINERAFFLIKNFNEEFKDRNPYWDKGPSKFFYEEIISAHKNYCIEDLLKSRNFLKDCYSCLSSWGLDKMGRRGPKMKDFEEFIEQINKFSGLIKILSSYEVGNPKSIKALFSLSEIFQNIQVLDNKTKLVANSKLLHFLLPNLSPIIDQQYIVRYFTQKNFNKKSMYILQPKDELDFFQKIFKIYNSLIYKYSLPRKGSLLEVDRRIVNYVRKKLVK
ncbi:MAG: hypothetical protein QW117_02830 [Candidatus Pacearchaeota archaeon]